MTVTLETLKADFEAAREAWAENEAATMLDASLRQLKITRDEYRTSALLKGNLTWFTKLPKMAIGRDFNGRASAMMSARLKAQVVDVYEEYGREAAMLYKLSDGEIDPRVRP